jgi:hypothetical protein
MGLLEMLAIRGECIPRNSFRGNDVIIMEQLLLEDAGRCAYIEDAVA